MQAQTTEKMHDFAGRLRFFRTQRGLSQDALGKLLGKKATTVSTWERGESEPSLDDIAAIAVQLKVSPSRLAYGEVVVTPPAPATPATPSAHQSEYRISGSSPPSTVQETGQQSATMLDPRFQPRGLPSTRDDVERYFRAYCDAAEASGDPDVFPGVMRQLKKDFPLDEFESPKENSP